MIVLNKSKLAFIAMMYFFAFIFPVVALINCSKWPHVFNLTESDCLMNYNFIKSTEELVRGFIYMGAFQAYIPIFVYIVFVIFLTHFAAKMFDKLPGKNR